METESWREFRCALGDKVVLFVAKLFELKDNGGNVPIPVDIQPRPALFFTNTTVSLLSI